MLTGDCRNALVIRIAALRITPKHFLIRRAVINQSPCTFFLRMCIMQFEHRGISFTLGFSDDACLSSRHDVFYCFFEHICYDLTMEPLLLQEGATLEFFPDYTRRIFEGSPHSILSTLTLNTLTLIKHVLFTTLLHCVRSYLYTICILFPISQCRRGANLPLYSVKMYGARNRK